MRKDAIVKTIIAKERLSHPSFLPLATSDRQLAKADEAIKSNQEFAARFQKEVEDVSGLQSDPDIAEERLQKLAVGLTVDNIRFLEKVMAKSQKSNDERGLAVEVLSLSSLFDAHEALTHFAENESLGLGTNSELELALRAQAIEGMAAYPDKTLAQKNLENLKMRTRFAFLNERAEKALSYLRGDVIDSEPQNARAVTK